MEHANTSSNELVEVIDTTNKMADLSAQVGKILVDFKEEFENVKQQTSTIEGITNDVTSLGENIKVVDSAFKEVENSNQTLEDNMKQVCEVMEVMTESINEAEATTKTMLSKYAESAKSAMDIETVVGHLMEELVVGGFMGVQDVRAGMKIAIALQETAGGKREFLGEVVEQVEKLVYVKIDNKGQEIIDRKDKHVKCQLRIVVDNVLYSWENIEINPVKESEKGDYRLTVETNPKVFNRRKYPRMPISNTCTIKVKENDKSYQGKMVNISANGFAFAVRDSVFASMKDKDVIVNINQFAVLDGKPLDGCIIRSSNNEGEYVVGCRMPSDNEAIKDYVSKNYCE